MSIPPPESLLLFSYNPRDKDQSTLIQLSEIYEDVLKDAYDHFNGETFIVETDVSQLINSMKNFDNELKDLWKNQRKTLFDV